MKDLKNSFLPLLVLLSLAFSAGCQQPPSPISLLVAFDATTSSRTLQPEQVRFAKTLSNEGLQAGRESISLSVYAFGPPDTRLVIDTTQVREVSELATLDDVIAKVPPTVWGKTRWHPMLRELLTKVKLSAQPVVVYFASDGEIHDLEVAKQLARELVAHPNVRGVVVGPATNALTQAQIELLRDTPGAKLDGQPQGVQMRKQMDELFGTASPKVVVFDQNNTETALERARELLK